MPTGVIAGDDAGEPIRTTRVGGVPNSPGGGGSGGAFGFGGGGGGLLGRAPVAGANLDNLRAMLRKRFVGSGAPGYATPAAPAAPPVAMPPASTAGGLQPWQGAPAAGIPPGFGGPMGTGGGQGGVLGQLAGMLHPPGAGATPAPLPGGGVTMAAPGQTDLSINRPGSPWNAPPPPASPPAGGTAGPPAGAPAPPPGGSTWGDINQSGNGIPGDINFGSGFLGTLNGILRNFLGGGTFSDQPNQGILDAVRSNALSDASASRSHNELLAQSLGADPATSASSALQASLGSQGDVAKAVSSAGLGELTHQRNFGQDLLETLLGRQGAQNQYDPNKTPWGAIIQALGNIGAVAAGKP